MSTRILQKGFTLIELVVVMVILGILAAVAVPQYVNLSKQARIAALKGVAGGVLSAASLSYAGNVANSCTATGLYVSGTSCSASGAINNWPDLTSTVIAGSLVTPVINATTTPVANTAAGVFTLMGAPGTCTATFTNATATAGPTVTYDLTNC